MEVKSLPFPEVSKDLLLCDFVVFSENFLIPDKILGAKEGILCLTKSYEKAHDCFGYSRIFY